MSRKTLLMALVVAVLLGVAACGSTVAEGRGAPAPSLEASAGQAPAGPPPVEVLRAWDARRADAWARGDVRLLSTLYTRDSVAGERDRTMLRAWLARGLVVHGLQTQLLEVRQLRRTTSTWTLIVTDRLVGGIAVGSMVRRPLPHDAPTTRTVELRQIGGSWLVSAVEPLDPGP
jgi:hypothetical protein